VERGTIRTCGILCSSLSTLELNASLRCCDYVTMCCTAHAESATKVRKTPSPQLLYLVRDSEHIDREA